MLNFKQLSLAKIAFVLLALVFVSSCSKEEITQQYPETLTMENWEQFVDAPQEVIDRLQAQERAQMQIDQSMGSLEHNGSRSLVFGWVRAWNSSWTNIAGVDVTTSSCWTSTTGSTPSGDNYFLSSTCANYKCFSYSTSAINGVSTLDLVLINRHILGYSTFCSYRELVAADVDLDGNLDTDDLDIIREVILGIRTSFPSDNVKFIGQQLYDYFDNDWNCGSGTYYAYIYGNCDAEMDYYAIKTGDVNGTFSF